MKKKRVLSYDVFRGVLLIGMVIFHIVVNLTPFKFNQEFFYWVPMGFVVFLGVILAKFFEGRDSKKFQLSGKLFLIFLLLNIPNFFRGGFGFPDIIQGNQKLFSFEIMIPMILVILGSALIEKLRMRHWLCGIFLFGVLVILHFPGFYSYNLAFTIYGLIGYFAGRNFDLNQYCNIGKYFVLSLIVLIASLFLTEYFALLDFVVLMQVFAMYFVFNFLFKENVLLVNLGKHSLFLYVAHVVFIKALSGYYKIDSLLEVAGFSVIFLAGLFLITFFVERRKWKLL